MIYGLYLSATGVMSNSYRQDVIANNLANSETIGFKRDLASFQERMSANNEAANSGQKSDPMLDKVGGGLIVRPGMVDASQGDLENTGNPLDVAVDGKGYFTVANGKSKSLTRDGAFMVDHTGDLVLSNSQGQHVLSDKGEPIHLSPGGNVSISRDGIVTQNGGEVGKIALVDVPDPSKFFKSGNTLLNITDAAQLRPASGSIRSGFQERSNVDPTTELGALMDAQRQLEANANMIKYQDTTMQELVNTVGKIT
jgi:flagellar basal-body rod protein FlgF